MDKKAAELSFCSLFGADYGLMKSKQLSVVLTNDVRQSKESREPQTCVGEARRLCDSKGDNEVKTTECCFDEWCSTKQGVTRAADLRRRSATTMRLEGTRTCSSHV